MSPIDLRPRIWFRKEYWELHVTQASHATEDGWSNEDVDVVPEDQRTWRSIDFLWLWLSDGGNVGTMQQAGSILALGLSWREAAVAIAVGNIIIAAAVTLNGAIGSRYHIPFTIASRTSMGFYFAYFAVVSRLALAMVYFGINTYIGSSCMLIMLRAIWPSFSRYPNALPASAGVTSDRLIAYFVFWVCQFPLLLIHPRKLRWLFLVKSVGAVVAALALLGWAVRTAGGLGPIFLAPEGSNNSRTLQGVDRRWAYLAGVNVAVAGKTTLALNMPDLARYAQRPSAAYWQLLFLPLVYWGFAFIGLVVASAGQVIYGRLYWDPTDIVARWVVAAGDADGQHTNRTTAFFCALALGLATLGTNLGTNAVAASNDLAFLAPRWLNLRRSAVVADLVGGWATCPWSIQASAGRLVAFLTGYVIVLAPLVAIMVADYWVFAGRQLDVPALYQRSGRYWYKAGVNWRALAALLVAVPVNLPGLIHTVDEDIKVGVAYARFYQGSWFTATSMAAAVYTGLSAMSPARKPTVPLLDHDDIHKNGAPSTITASKEVV